MKFLAITLSRWEAYGHGPARAVLGAGTPADR
ncbi:predicted protein [Streptomyces iranensis]|uniref:Uncharacterized protein n=1 Tax=Streptomyces iranensis TaxID=576784 RepID=A0A060ZCI7_9ACTN|nr:hypothetical protein [Streptomyces iranensis]CDR02143.1 predicted protein [Streptomyces iranensis]